MNKVILMGRLTREPEIKYSTNGNNTAVTRFNLAVDRRFHKPGEEKQADFIPVVTFGKTAEFCSKYFTRGSRVAVVGSIQTRTWDDAEGKKRYATDVIVEEAYFADSKNGNGGNRGDAAEPTGNGEYDPTSEEDLPF